MNLSQLGLNAVLALNVLWFGAGAVYFGLQGRSAAKLLVAREERGHPLFATLAASVRFLGGLNLAFAALSAVMLCGGPALFPEGRQVAALAGVIALAHGSQFAANLPVALRGGSPWPVLSGRMYFIFCVDFALMVANAVVAVQRWP